VSLYFLDWDVAGRAQTVEILRASDSAVLDSRSVSSFSQGVYLTYDINCNVTVRVTKTAGVNCVLNGIFFGGTTTPTNSAVFLSSDTTTKGSWTTVYGADGYNVIGNAFAYPSYATVTPAGKADYTWADPTTDIRALQKVASSTDRISSVWYATPNFTVDINISGTQEKRVALYCLDWDLVGRSQRIDMIDIATGNTLDSRTLNSFGNGTYMVYRMKGNIRIKFVNLGPNNALLNGIFFDPYP
jgi:hypothetical protein